MTMEILFFLLPISLILVGLIVWALLWAIRSGQFEDLEGPAQRLLMDDDEVSPEPEHREADKPGGS